MSGLHTDHAGAVAILERFVSDNPALERSAARRVFAEVVRAWPGETQRLWVKWFTEASDSLGLRTKFLECSVSETSSLAADQAQFVCYRQGEGPGHGEWMAVLASSKRRYQVLVAGRHEDTHTVSKHGLRKLLKQFVQDGRVQCIVMQPSESAMSSDYSGSNGHRFTPLERLSMLLRPEASDIWIVVIFAFVVSLLMLAIPMAVEALVNTVAFGRFLQPIVFLALVLLTFLAFQGAIRALQTYVVEIIQRRLFARVAGDLAFRLPRTDVEATAGHSLPELVNRFFDVVTVQKVTAQLLLDGLGLLLSTLIGMAVLGFYHPWLLGFDLFLLIAIAIIVFVLGRGAIPSAVKESKHKYYMAEWLQDVARCPISFRMDGGADFALDRADRLIHEYLSARRKHFRIVMRQVLFALALQAVSSTVLLGLGGWLVVLGELTLGQLVAAELIVTVIVGSFAKFGKHMEGFYDLLASVDKLGVLFDIGTERLDGMLAIEQNTPAELEFDTVSYAYSGRPNILEAFTGKIPRGARVAIIGIAGSGKSTLLDLIYGLRTPSSGYLTIDGFDPQDLRPDILRSRIAMARGIEVFHATVEENVHLYRDTVTATQLRDLLSHLGLLDAVLELRDGCATMLTSEGAPLSENQLRLLVLARAMIGQPGLLLIDGLLDSLSPQNLDRCLEYLLDPQRPWTLIVTTTRQEIADRFQSQFTLEHDAKANRQPIDMRTQ